MKNGRIWIFFILLSTIIMNLAGCSNGVGDNSSLGTADIPPLVEQWRGEVENYARQYGIEQYVELILAIIYQESGGDSEKYPDIMQCSESAGLPPNSFTTPQESLNQGIKYLAALFDTGNAKGVDTNTVIQSYNFGGGFIPFVAENYNGTYSQEAAKAFSQKMCDKLHTNSYGDVLYVEHVTSKLVKNENANGLADFSTLEAAFLEYKGVPYVYGGSSKAGIDCSGLTQLSYREIGITLPRTAQEQYNKVKHISVSQAEPGDLIFFKGTNTGSPNYITHVGIYVGNNQMFHASSSKNQCMYTNVNTPYYEEHLAGFGRVK